MKKRRTAVEYLYIKMYNLSHPHEKQHKVFEEAKAMEKEQHRKTYHQGLNSNFQDFEQYYNETYEEIWKVIPNTSNWYAVSNLGHVKSFKSREEKILTPWVHRNKLRVTLCLRGGRKHFYVKDLFKKAFE